MTLHPQTNILVVEDEASLRLVLKMELERAGYQVRTAEDGLDALQKIQEELPSLVLLDVMMPNMDGYEVCSRIKSDLATASVPVIMLTGRTEHEDKLRGLRGGANDYITKPYEKDELLARVGNMLVWSMMQREANPLTGLPGNTAIESELAQRLRSETPFTFMYIDIDHFKAFNDYYSFRKGDEAIRLTASILTTAVSIEGSGHDFVGHVGGDDFVMIVDSACAAAIADMVVKEFDAKIPRLYHDTDRQRGYIQTTDRVGVERRFPIMTLTIAAITNQDRKFEHLGELSQVAAELKAFGKSQAGSIVVWNRRQAA
ncbi:MAG: response regulator [Candidatus Eisenbacteria bacterium]|nr:response regulator [Candidatus Eisenbacteria bacterium]